MIEEFKKQEDPLNEDNIDLIELITIVWSGKYIIVLLTSVSALLSIIFSLYLPNIYSSSAVLASASKTNSLSNAAASYKGLAGFAGISIPKQESDKVAMGLEIMQSLDFYEKFVASHNLYIPLQASKGWNKSLNKLVIDSNIYDETKMKWISEKPFSKNGMPSAQESHREFQKLLTINRDEWSGFIIISFKHYSPFVAQKVVDLLIEDINEITRAEDIAIAQESIKYLQSEVQDIQLNDIRLTLNNLIQSQIETITLANAKPEYLLKVLSSPTAAELKSEPPRSIIVIFITFIGFALSILFTLLRHFYLKKIS